MERVGRYELLEPRRTDRPVRARDAASGVPVEIRFVRFGALSLDAPTLRAVLDHPHALRLRELVGAGDALAIVSDAGPERRLADLLPRARRGLPPGLAAAILERVAAAISHAHALGLVHGALAPSAVRVGGRRDAPDVRLAGLELAVPEGQTLPLRRGDEAWGFAAPELRRGPASAARSLDVYGLGALLRAAAPRDRALAAVARQAMERDPARRPPSVRAFVDDLREAAATAAAATGAGRARFEGGWVGGLDRGLDPRLVGGVVGLAGLAALAGAAALLATTPARRDAAPAVAREALPAVTRDAAPSVARDEGPSAGRGEAPPAPRPREAAPERLGVHAIAPGESLYCIARAYGVDPSRLARANGMPWDARLRAGGRLAVPAARWSEPVPGRVCAAQFASPFPPIPRGRTPELVARGAAGTPGRPAPGRPAPPLVAPGARTGAAPAEPEPDPALAPGGTPLPVTLALEVVAGGERPVVEITAEVAALVERHGLAEGEVLLFAADGACALAIVVFEPGTLPAGAPLPEPRVPSLPVPVSGGALRLGPGQRIVLATAAADATPRSLAVQLSGRR